MRRQTAIKNPKNYELAEFYGVFRTTISNYKHGDICKKRLYKAMVKFYQEQNNLKKSKTVCNNCIYANKNMIKDKIVCDIFVSTNRKGTVEKDFGCNKGKTKC